MTDSFRMTTQMAKAMGYDAEGNAPDLLAAVDKEKIDTGKIQRADGNSVCWVCNLPYRMHPRVQGALWLRRVCDREDLFKL